MPKISIVIPMYNCADYVDDILNQVLGQSFSDLEIICVLDGMDEEIKEKIDRRAEEDKRLICVVQEHSGAGAARNTGLAKARGEYIIFLDSDDQYSSTMMERLYSEAKEFDADAVICSYTLENLKTGRLLKGTGFDFSLFKEKTAINPAEAKCFLGKTVLAPWNKMFRRQMVVDNKLRFSNTRMMNDVFFSATALMCSQRMVVIKEDLLITRRFLNKDSISSSRAKHTEDLLVVEKEIYDWLKANDKWKTFSDSYYMAFKNSVHYEICHAYNEKLVDGLAKSLSMDKPWVDMCNQELYETVFSDVAETDVIRQKLADEVTVFENIIDTSMKKEQLYMEENRLKAYKEILERMKSKYGRDMEKKGSPVKWLPWSIKKYGVKGTIKNIRKDKISYLDFIDVNCAGHITAAGHFVVFFLPADVKAKQAVVENLSLVIRCNGYYPIAVSGENNDVKTRIGPNITPIIKGEIPVRKNEILNIQTVVTQGVGINIFVKFKDTLRKNPRGNKVDNNQPVSVTMAGKIRLE